MVYWTFGTIRPMSWVAVRQYWDIPVILDIRVSDLPVAIWRWWYYRPLKLHLRPCKGWVYNITFLPIGLLPIEAIIYSSCLLRWLATDMRYWDILILDHSRNIMFLRDGDLRDPVTYSDIMTNTLILGLWWCALITPWSGRYSDDNMSIFRVFWRLGLWGCAVMGVWLQYLPHYEIFSDTRIS